MNALAMRISSIVLATDCSGSSFRIALAVWHRKELVKCDPGYEERELIPALLKARHEAQEKGISASDPRYPDLESVKKEKGYH